VRKSPVDTKDGWSKRLGIWWGRHPALAPNSAASCFIWRKSAIAFKCEWNAAYPVHVEQAAMLTRPDEAFRIVFNSWATEDEQPGFR
jgi:hypothetical protein